ncbi:MAG: hypothetical protein Fur0020_13840 [Thermodesulfovibrionia bacterium]
MNLQLGHLISFWFLFTISGAIVWRLKKVFFIDVHTSTVTKIIVFIMVLLSSVLLTFLIRKRANAYIEVLVERLRPLIWIFGSLVFLSSLIVLYNMRWEYNTSLPAILGNNKASINRPNIILVTFDALASREMSLYGYHRKTTPFIDEWARDAHVFTNVKSASNFTTSATASLMTGKRVWTHRVFQLEGSKPINSDLESLPHLLKKNGYFNMAFIVNPHTSVKVLGMSDSFDIAPLAIEFSESHSLFGWKFGVVESLLYRFFGDRIRLHNWLLQRNFVLDRFINLISRNLSVTEVPPEDAFNRFIDILDKRPPQPFFAWIHLFPPHDPYLPSGAYKGYFKQSDELRTYKEQEAIRMEAYRYTFQYKPFPDEMKPLVNHLRNYYDEFVRYCDDTFRDFIMELQRRGIIDNTVIILSSDHGESFEHGYFTHGGPFLYEDVVSVPLIIKEPHQEEGRVINDPIEQIDIPPTILDYAGIGIPSWMEGRSLMPLIEGKALAPKMLFSMVLEKNPVNAPITKGTVAVWDGDYKLIYYIEKGESLLFDLKTDPQESRDIKGEALDVAERLQGVITGALRDKDIHSRDSGIINKSDK